MAERELLAKKTDAAIEAFKTERLRWVMGLSQVGPKIDERKYREISGNIMKDEIERQLILNELKQRGPLTIKELAETTKILPKEILRHMIALRKAGAISETGVKGDGYLYKVK
jgi:DNA-binding transcriptional ArsR family regulator